MAKRQDSIQTQLSRADLEFLRSLNPLLPASVPPAQVLEYTIAQLKEQHGYVQPPTQPPVQQ